MGYAVKFEEVFKRYPRGGPRYASLRQELADSLRRIGRRLRGQAEEPRGTLALDRVSFEVQEGEAFAIIGPNGAGKTTALKLISRITYPTSGRVRVRGRVGALIEVGSGVHPELTARENIWLYGQILGISKAEIRHRFDEIVEFAELGHVLDTPVKMYSSGMQLRLGFSIASHLDPDIFLVDEALAVGDAGFQAKCVERMSKLVREGRTLILVSHNLSAVEALCTRGLFLLGGNAKAMGETREVMRSYLDWIDERDRVRKNSGTPLERRGLAIECVTVHGQDGAERYAFTTGERIEVRFGVWAKGEMGPLWFSVGLTDGRPGALVLCSMLEYDSPFEVTPGQHVVSCHLGPLPLAPRTYELWMSVREELGAADLVEWSSVGAIRFRLKEEGKGPTAVSAPWLWGPVRVDHHWRID